jgi:hypothetical protein
LFGASSGRIAAWSSARRRWQIALADRVFALERGAVFHQGPAAPLPTDLAYRKQILWLWRSVGSNRTRVGSVTKSPWRPDSQTLRKCNPSLTCERAFACSLLSMGRRSTRRSRREDDPGGSGRYPMSISALLLLALIAPSLLVAAGIIAHKWDAERQLPGCAKHSD